MWGGVNNWEGGTIGGEEKRLTWKGGKGTLKVREFGDKSPGFLGIRAWGRFGKG